MRNIEITEKDSDFFSEKYSTERNSYKNFLESIIEYKYNKNDLVYILNDIRLRQESQKNYSEDSLNADNKNHESNKNILSNSIYNNGFIPQIQEKSPSFLHGNYNLNDGPVNNGNPKKDKPNNQEKFYRKISSNQNKINNIVKSDKRNSFDKDYLSIGNLRNQANRDLIRKNQTFRNCKQLEEKSVSKRKRKQHSFFLRRKK